MMKRFNFSMGLLSLGFMLMIVMIVLSHGDFLPFKDIQMINVILCFILAVICYLARETERRKDL